MGEPEAPQKSRYGLLSIVMFAVLVLALGAAWWLANKREDAADRATAVIGEIRSKGLGFFLPQETVQTWFIADGQPTVGWTMSTVSPAGDGFAGAEYFGGTDVRSIDAEHWQLDANARNGSYTGLGDGAVTTIRLEGSQVTIDNAVRSEAPPNYIPEGLLPLVVRLVGREATPESRGKPVTFNMIFNQRAISGRQVRFTAVTLKADRPGTVTLSGVGGDRVYHLDSAGEIIAWSQSGATFRRSTAGEVLRRYPAAAHAVRDTTDFIREIRAGQPPRSRPLESSPEESPDQES